jgi:hypothetical protein
MTAQADGFYVEGGTTPRRLTVSGGNIQAIGGGAVDITFPTVASTLAILGANTFTGAQVLMTGTTSVAALNFPAGAVKTSNQAAADWEFDGKCFYSSPTAASRGVSPSVMFSIVPSGNFNLATTSGVQSAFPTTGDVWTLESSTSYFFEGLYNISHSTTTCTLAMAFALGGGVTITSMRYYAISHIGAANATATASNSTIVDRVASTVVSITSTANFSVIFQGIIRMNAGGTVTPQINFSANTTSPVMLADSYIRFTPIGSNTVAIIGNVG